MDIPEPERLSRTSDFQTARIGEAPDESLLPE